MSYFKILKKLQGNWSVELATDATRMEVECHCSLACARICIPDIFSECSETIFDRFLRESSHSPNSRKRERESTVLMCDVPQVSHQSAKAVVRNHDPLCPSEAWGWSKSELDFHLRRPWLSGKTSNCSCSGKQSCSWRLLNLDGTLKKRPYRGNRPIPKLKKKVALSLGLFTHASFKLYPVAKQVKGFCMPSLSVDMEVTGSYAHQEKICSFAVFWLKELYWHPTDSAMSEKIYCDSTCSPF